MYILKTEASFDAAHFLYGYEGKCSNIHGHRWKVEVEIKSEDLIEKGEKRGMIIDFADLKKDVKEMVDVFDHSLIYEDGSLKENTVKALLDEDFLLNKVSFRPTAENLSKFFYDQLAQKDYSVKRITVYETPNNCAIYEE